MEFDLHQLFRSARRWWWIILLGPLLTCGIAVAYTKHKPELYEASAKLFIDPSGSGQLDYQTILSAQQLVQTYQRLVKNQTVLDAVAADPSIGLSAGEISNRVRVAPDGDTQLLVISVDDTVPARAAAIANSMADQFSKYIKNQSSSVDGNSVDQLQDSVDTLDKQIQSVQTQINAIQAQGNAASPSAQGQLSSLQATLEQLQPTYASLLSDLAASKAKAATDGNRVAVYERAYAPSAPYSPSLPVNVMLAFILGIMLSAGLVRLLDYLDNTVKSSSDFTEIAGAPLLSSVMVVPNISSGRRQLFVVDQPKSGAAESIRLLRTNIEFASATKEIATLGVTSANPGEGKSTIAANLAITLAQAGFVTALMDTDLRRPSQHRLFGVSNERGMSTLLTVPDRTWSWAARETLVPNLTLIPSGPLPPNPADLLSLDRLRQLLGEMRSTFDVIVVDTPPVLSVSDPLIIAAHVDGMIVVAKGGKTRIDAVKRAAQTLQRGSIRIIGFVVNQQGGSADGSYYQNDYHAVAEDAAASRKRRHHADAPKPALDVASMDHTSAD